LKLALLLVGMPALCMPAAGSPLRFPDTDISSFTLEAAASGSFDFRNRQSMQEAWSIPEADYGTEAEPPLDLSVTTDLPAEAIFGPTPEITLSQAAILDPVSFPVPSGSTGLLFLLIGISASSVRLILAAPQSWRTRAKRGRFSSQLPQIIHLTRSTRLP
jgi:hypothetical protein